MVFIVGTSLKTKPFLSQFQEPPNTITWFIMINVPIINPTPTNHLPTYNLSSFIIYPPTRILPTPNLCTHKIHTKYLLTYILVTKLFITTPKPTYYLTTTYSHITYL
jgi:hypothetical protein